MPVLAVQVGAHEPEDAEERPDGSLELVRARAIRRGAHDQVIS